jgi:hypothetical protein
MITREVYTGSGWRKARRIEDFRPEGVSRRRTHRFAQDEVALIAHAGVDFGFG